MLKMASGVESAVLTMSNMGCVNQVVFKAHHRFSRTSLSAQQDWPR